MKTEQLMQKRVKVINDYPESIFQIGEILVCVVDEEEGTQYVFGHNQYADNLCPELYPAIFKKLEWWEDRKPEDMPEYVKEVESTKVVKVTRYFIDNRCYVFYTDAIEKKGKWKGMETPFNLRAVIPATIEEYNEYRLLNP